MLPIFILIVLPMIFLMGRYYVKRRIFVNAVNKFPGPPLLPILGNALDFIGSTEAIVKRVIDSYAKKYKSPFRVWILHMPIVVVAKPEDIQIISSKNLEKDSLYRFLADLIGDGLITCSEAKWKRRRRIVSPAFCMPNLIKNFLGVFHKHSRDLVLDLQKECRAGNQIDIWPRFVRCTFASICENALGYTTGHNEKEISKMNDYLDAHQKASTLVGKRIYQPWLHLSWTFSLYKYMTGRANLIKQAQALPRLIIQKQKKATEKKLQQKYETKDEILENLIDTLMAANENNEYFDEAEVTDEILTIMFGGNETTAVTTCFNLLLCAINQEVQDKVYAELEEIFGDDDRFPTPDDLQKMTFLEQCIKETLRWSSAVPLLLRYSDKDIELTDGAVIPAYARIVLAPFLVHHDETIYPNPYSWNPDNFHAEKIANRHFYSFAAFGVGERTCLGSKYAMMSIKVTTSTIFRKYKLTTNLKEKDIEFDVGFMLRKLGEYPIQFEYRLPQRQSSQ